MYFLAHFIDCRLFFYSFFSSRSLIHTLSIAVTSKKHKYKSTKSWSDVLSCPFWYLVTSVLYVHSGKQLLLFCVVIFSLTWREMSCSTTCDIELNSRRSWFISFIDILIDDDIILLYISNWYTILCIRSYMNFNVRLNTCINCNFYKTNNQTWFNHHSE